MHELSAGWSTPLDQKHPTLAEFLGNRGYSTAGFVANTYYCGADTGLARGFTHYQDFIFPELTALKTAALVSRTLEGMRAIAGLKDWLESVGLLSITRRLVLSLDADRKPATAINNELLDWLSRRGQRERSFFAFVNYYDAHYPYKRRPFASATWQRRPSTWRVSRPALRSLANLWRAFGPGPVRSRSGLRPFHHRSLRWYRLTRTRAIIGAIPGNNSLRWRPSRKKNGLISVASGIPANSCSI
jgi:hypothetical protein